MSYTFIAPIKHPFAELNHGMNWADNLDEGEQIIGLPVVEVNPAGLTIDQISITEALVQWRVSGGTDKKDYTVTVKITTNLQEGEARSVRYRVRNR